MVSAHNMGILEPRNYYGEVTGTINMGNGVKHTDASTVVGEPATGPLPGTGAPQVRLSAHASGPSTDPEAYVSGNEHVPSRYSEASDDLKRTSTSIVLFPQPHDDPNDPLNWPIWRRDLALAVIGFHSFICGGMTPLLAAGFAVLSVEFDVTQAKLAYLVGPFMLAMSVGSVIFAPTAVLYGKRLVYLIGQVVFLAGTLWGGGSNSFNSLLGARIIMGIGAGTCEALPSTSIAEIYFLHERAYRLGLYTLLLLGGKNIVPMIAGFIIGDIGWKWLFWIVSMIIGMNFFLTFFFVPETWWDRTAVPSDKRSITETRMAREARLISRQSSFQREIFQTASSSEVKPSSSDDTDTSTEKTTAGSSTIVRPPNTRHITIDDTNNQSIVLPPDQITESDKVFKMNARYLRAALSSRPPVSNPNNKKRPYADSLKIYYGKFTADKWWMVALRPFCLFAYPGILFSIFVYALSVLWLIVISETVSKIFSKAPYNFSTTSVGLLYISTFIGGCLGSAIAGKMSDLIVREMARRNDGVYEPEFRLIMIIPVVLSVSIGMMGFGWSTYVHDLWIVPAVFLGVIGFGCSLGSTTAITYSIDSYKAFSAETLVALNIGKNVLGFVFSFFVPNFLKDKGSRTLYITFGGVEIFVCLWAIPLYIYGKRLRRWTDKKNMLKWSYVDVDQADEKEPIDTN